jgi:hypothetical protein
MIATLLFVAFLAMMLMGVPIGAALGLAGAAAIALANADSQWFGLLAVPQNFYAGLGKYPLLAIPMFVLVGSIFDRSGVALRLVNFAVAIVGRGPGMLPLVAIAVAMFLGGISGSGPANAAAVGAVMIAAMSRAGYPPAFSASVVGAAAATDILIPPSVAFIVYSVLVPGASVPALFAAGMIPGVLAGMALIVPAVWMARKHKMGALEPPAAPAVLEEPARSHLGPGRAGADPGRHARGLVHADRGRRGGGVLRPVRGHGDPPHDQVRDLFPILRESGELSAVILLVVSLAGIFAYSLSTLGVIDPVQGHRELGAGRIRRAGAADRAADHRGHVPRRHLDLPDLRAAAAAHHAALPLGPGLVRRDPHAEGGAGPVHPAAGREPDGVVPHRRRAHGVHRALGRLDAAGHVPGDGAGDRFPQLALWLPAQNGLLISLACNRF